MSLSQSCGTAVVPFLARLVLGVAFVTAGYNKVVGTAQFDGAQAATLRSLGVAVKDEQGNAVARSAGAAIRLASFRQDDDGAITALPAPEIEEGQGEVIELPQPAEEVADAVTEIVPLPEGTYTAPRLHRITLLCHDAKWPQPVLMAWVAAITELVGGGLILVGFLSRIWGLGLAIAMGSAFYLVSMGILEVHKANPLTFAESTDNYTTVIAQLSLFVLAFGVVLTGAGPLSVDHMLFRRGGHGSRGKRSGASAPAAQPAPRQQAAPPAPMPHIPPVPADEPMAPPRPASGGDAPPRRPL